ncbi:fibrous sheath-interacting protein 1 [Pholidichthys leucotaenia]
MEIIRGSLEDISRPASGQQTGSRVSSVSLPHGERICSTSPFSLVVLSSDATADIQIRNNPEDTAINSLVKISPDKDDAEKESQDPKLQKAIEKMKRLDEMLSAEILKHREIQCQRKELQARLWQELWLNKPEGHRECSHETLNTRLFLALEEPTGTEEDDDHVPVFKTQVLDCEHQDGRHLEQSKKGPDTLTESFELGHGDTEQGRYEGSRCGDSIPLNKQKDFVRRNVELASGEGGEVFLTQAEKKRLDELLREIDEVEEDGAKGADGEDSMWAVSVLTGQGYTLEPSDLEQLIDIDSKIRLLLPVGELHSVENSFTNLSMCQGSGSEASWKCDGDRQPGEKVLQDIKESRGQERRLQEIQRQLELLDQGQEMTSDSPDLTEEQLFSLLEQCELTESWSNGLEEKDSIL